MALTTKTRLSQALNAFSARMGRQLKAMLEAWVLDNNGTDPSFGSGWRDLTSAVSAAGIPASSAPSRVAFGPSGAREEYAFDVNEYIFMDAFHVDHDVKPGGKAYVHVHWSTNGTNTGLVKWSFEIMRARGHQQEAFAAPVTVTVEQAGSGTAWKHMVAECAVGDALTLTEPDELILVTLKRVAPSSGSNADTVFGLTVDFHYETDRYATPSKSPDFYVA